LAKGALAPTVCHMTLAEYSKYCCTGQLPRVIAEAIRKGGFLGDLLCAADIIGGLEPLSATRPGVCDPVIVVDKDITVPPATLNADGTVTPSEVRVTSYCAPMNRALVIQESRVTAANATAAKQPITQPVYKRVNLGTFGEWCLPFEPPDEPGQFVNVEHIIAPPESGYSVYVQNFDPTSEAVYHFHSRMWASC
jgi:hypothetical protein